MNWFCCDRYYTLGCYLDCGCVVLPIEATQTGTYIVEYSYFNSSVIHSIEIRNVEVGNFLQIDKSFNSNNFINLKIIQPDGTYHTEIFYDNLGNPILDETNLDEFGQPIPLQTECFNVKINPERLHYPVYQDFDCENCDVENGYAVSNFSFYDLLNSDIQYVKIGDKTLDLLEFSGKIEGEGLSASDIHTNIITYFTNISDIKIANLIKDSGLSIVNMGTYLRLKIRSDFSDLCDTVIEFLDEDDRPLYLNASKFECCLESEITEKCQFSPENATFFVKLNSPIYNDFKIVINADNIDGYFTIESRGFSSLDELDEVLEDLNNAYDNYSFERFDNETIIIYTNKYNCDSYLNFYMKRSDNHDYFDINFMVDGAPNLTPYCCETCDFTGFAKISFNPLEDLNNGFFLSVSGVNILDLPNYFVSDFSIFQNQMLIDFPTINVYQDANGVNLEIPYDIFNGYDVCGRPFDIYKINDNGIQTLFDNVEYLRDNLVYCCYDD